MKLFTGTAHPALAHEVSRISGMPIAECNVLRFGNSEVKVRINEQVKGEDCYVIQPTTNPTDTNIIELCFFADALIRQGARSVSGIVPYFGYAKQNIQHVEGECVSMNVIIRILETVGFSKIYAFDLHDEASAGVFDIPFKPLSAYHLMADHLKAYFKNKNIPESDLVFVSPDQGAAETIRTFSEYFFEGRDFHEVVIEKKRDQNTPHKAEPVAIYGDVAGKVAVIIDDMIVSGSTVAPAVNLLLEKGATEVYAGVIHHDFTTDAPKLMQDSKLKRFFTTNTIPLRTEQKFEKLEEISVAQIIADALANEKA